MASERMHADEVPVDVALVRRLLAEQFPEWADLSVHPVTPWGTDNAVYRLGDAMVARLPRTPRTSRTLEMERQWLPRLAPQLPLAIPLPLANGTPAKGYPFLWSVYRWLPGDNATSEHITDMGQLAADLARFIAALQRIDPAGGPPPSEVNSFRGVPLARRDAGTRAAIASLQGVLDIVAVTAAWDEALGAPEWERPPVWLHGDLDSRNLLAENGRLSAVIDFGTLSVGDPACDVMVAWKMLSAEARDAFRTVLSVDEATWARSRGWALSQAVTALAYYTEQTNAVLVREATRWITEVLADHDPTANGAVSSTVKGQTSFPEETSLDPESEAYANEVTHRLQAILGGNLIGVYLHGSGVLGDFSRQRSDIDILAVVEHLLSDREKRAVARQLSSASLPSPVGELEFHIVERRVLTNTLDAPPFELHIATGRAGASDRVVDGRGRAGDSDLVMHFAVLSEYGHALVGPSASEIFPQIGREKLIEAFAGELQWASEHASPSYQVLNAARAWRFLEEDVLGSKLEGGQWARQRVGDTATIDAAIKHREGQSETQPDATKASTLLQDVLKRLDESRAKPDRSA